MIKVVFKLAKDVKKIADAEKKRVQKALEIAQKREGFLLAAELRKNIRAGHAGGQSFDKLSSMARRYAGKFPARRPFTRLHSTRLASGPSKRIIPIRYNPLIIGGIFRGVEVGMVNTRQEKISKSWLKIIKRQQEGFSQTITDRQRRSLANIGGDISKRSKLRKHFFIKKSTTKFKTRGRQIIIPFWKKWQRKSGIRTINNFHKKLAGQRI